MLPCGPWQLQHILSFILPTESIPREVRKIEGGQGNRVGALSSACCRVEHNKIASAADTPLSLQCQRVREAGSPLWTSCLGLHSAGTKRMSEKKTEWCLLPFLMPLTPCWPLTHGIPRQWKYNLDGASHCFSYTAKGGTSCPLPLAVMSPWIPWKFHLPCENVLGAVMEWNLLHPEEVKGRICRQMSLVLADRCELFEGAAVPGCCWPSGRHALSELEMLLWVFSTKYLGWGLWHLT